MNNDLIPYKELGLTPEKQEILRNFLYYKNEVKKFEKELKDSFKECVESGLIPVNSIDLGGFVLSYTKGYSKKQVDTQKLKEEGIYEVYTKTTEVKPSVSMKIKEEE